MIPFLTEIAEFLTAAMVLSMAVTVFKKSDEWNILPVAIKAEAK